MSKRLLILFVCFFMSALLAGCGFHLRGHGKAGLSPELSVLQVHMENVSNNQLRREVERALGVQADVRIAPESENGIPVLTLFAEQSSTRVLSFDENRNVTQFLMRYRVDFDVRDAAGKEMVERQTILLNRDFLFDKTQVLAMERESQELRQQMREDAVQQMIRRLASWSP